MAVPLLTSPLSTYSLEEQEVHAQQAWNYSRGGGISLTPIDEAVQAVREAQDSVGKDIWEKE